MDPHLLTEEAYVQLYDGISTQEIDKATVLAARSRIAYEPNYQYAGARLLLYSLYREVFQKRVDGRTLHKDYRESFLGGIQDLVQAGKLNGDLLTKFDLEALSEALRPERDFQFKYLGAQTLYDRYLLRLNHVVETPQAFWMRVAMGLCLNESDPTEMTIQAYEQFSTFKSCPATPTLFNSGTPLSQLSSCFLSTLSDSIDGIYGMLHSQARLSKYAGGLGIDITPLRGSGAKIKGTAGKSNGIVPWAKQINDLCLGVNQGGRRPGAAAIYLEPWHIDLLDFLDLKRNTGDDRRRCHDLHTALWMPDLFFKQLEYDGDWYFFSPDECPDLHDKFGEEFEKAYWGYVEKAQAGQIKITDRMKAKDVWKKILAALKETGHPWITFKDPANVRYSDGHYGAVHSSNLCTEIIRHSVPDLYEEQEVKEWGETAVCNLQSINLAAHQHLDGTINWGELEKTVKRAIRLLDNVIDLNYYPIKSARNSNLRYRPIGLGLMGWMDFLHRAKVVPDSDEAIRLAGEIQEYISYWAIEASIELAQERGPYEKYEGSSWSQGKLPMDTYDDLMFHRGDPRRAHTKLDWGRLRYALYENGIRNGNLMAIAPTVTISSIVGASPSIDPNYSALYVNSTLSGEFTMINEWLIQELKERGLWSEDTARELQRCDGDVLQMVLPADLQERFRTAFDLDQMKLIEATAQRQIWIDQGQSHNLFYKGNSMREMSDFYLKAWRDGLKTTYYLHTRAASRVEKSVKEECRLGEACESCQ